MEMLVMTMATPYRTYTLGLASTAERARALLETYCYRNQVTMVGQWETGQYGGLARSGWQEQGPTVQGVRLEATPYTVNGELA